MNNKIINMIDKIDKTVAIVGNLNRQIIARLRSGILLLFMGLVIIISPVLGQADPSGQNQDTTGQNNDSEEESEELKKLLEYLVIMEKYGPKSLEKEFITRNFENKLLKGIKDSLAIVSNQMQSSFDTLDHYYTVISNDIRLRNYSYYRLDFGFEKDYSSELYKVLQIRHNHYLDKNLKYLHQIEGVIDDNGDLLIQAFGEDAINPIIFETKYLVANILLFKNGIAHLYEALERYEYLLGRNSLNKEFIPNDGFRNKVHMVILDIYDRLLYYTYTINTDFTKMIMLNREKLSYLWKIVDFNHDNQNIKDAKYRRLYRVYSPIMDPGSDDYKNLYGKYRRDEDKYPVLNDGKDGEEDQTTQDQGQSDNQGDSSDTPPADDVNADSPNDQSGGSQ